jgi:hypothetical protein
VLAGVDRGQGHLVMEMGWGGDHDRVDRVVFEQDAEVA